MKWDYDSAATGRSFKRDLDSAIADFTQVIKLNPSDARAYFCRGNAYYFKDDRNSAIADHNQTIKLSPGKAKAYEWLYDFFCLLTEDKDRATAIAYFTQIIECNPDDANAYKCRGNFYRTKGYNDSLHGNIAWGDWCNFYCTKGDNDSAIADFTQAIKLDPSDADAYRKRGNAYLSKGDWDSAIADYNQAFCCSKDDNDSAIADYTKAIKLGPNDADAYKKRGDAYDSLGDFYSAYADYAKAMRLDPDDAGDYNNRGNAYYHFKGQSMSHKKVGILWGLKQLVLILEGPTGVWYCNQVGGHSCSAQAAEGTLVLADSGDYCEELEAALAKYTYNLWGLTEENADYIDTLLEKYYTEHYSVSMMKVNRKKLKYSQEAWIYVIVTSHESTGYGGLPFSGFDCKYGVLTWENSD